MDIFITIDLFQTPEKYDIFICHRKTYDTLFLDVEKCVDSESAVHFVVRDRFLCEKFHFW